tara:strand:- start:473 stop:970 length:498 start_codon:yes stop_codon:yes gene_type:complete
MDNNIILKNPIFKMFKDELETMLQTISKTYDIDYDELKKLSFSNSKMAIQYGIRKRIKRKIDKDKQCMGRKIDGYQCTRSRKDKSEYCLSHQKNLKFGRIDDGKVITPDNERKKKKTKGDDYIATKRKIIENITYLIDEKNNIYSYNIETPVLLGKYDTYMDKIV